MSTYEQHDHEAGKRASGLVMAGFGTLWWLAGAGPVGGVPGSAALALGVVIGLTLWASVVWVLRHQQLRSVRHRPEPPRTEGMS